MTFVGGGDFLYTYGPQALVGHFSVRFGQVLTRETRHLDYLLQFTSDIRFIKGCENVPVDATSHGINAHLLDLCVDYQRFVEEQTKNQLLQLLLQDNTTSLKLSSTDYGPGDRVQYQHRMITPLCTRKFMEDIVFLRA